MIGFFKNLFQSPKSESPPAAPDDKPLAVACLLVEAACADQSYTDDERRFIEDTLASQFSLSADAAADLRNKADATQDAAADVHQFTRIVKAMPPEEKISLVENMWRIVLSDDTKDPHEDALMRRICGLLYVSDVDSGAARRRVEAQRKS